jgi:hypothetical protein
MALDQLKEQWGAWLRGDAPTAEWQREVGTWKALLTLLLMRGANPFQSALYNSLDRSMYAAITSAMHHDIPWNDALARVRDALDAGANPNFDGSGMKDAGLPAPSFLATFNPEEPSEWPPVLNVALVSGEVDLVKLLVDAGAVYGRGRHRFPLDKFWDALNVYLRLLLGKVANMPEGQEENDIQETTMKVLKMLEEKCAAMRGSAAHHMAARLNYWRTVNRALVATRLAWVYQTIERIQNMLALAPAHNRRVVEDSDDDSDEEE